jgi:hypothetical protein
MGVSSKFQNGKNCLDLAKGINRLRIEWKYFNYQKNHQIKKSYVLVNNEIHIHSKYYSAHSHK